MADGAVRIEINHVWCKGCYLCISVCPRQVLSVSRDDWISGHYPVVVSNIERCTACRNCELYCPDLAIEVIDESAEGDSALADLEEGE